MHSFIFENFVFETTQENTAMKALQVLAKLESFPLKVERKRSPRRRASESWMRMTGYPIIPGKKHPNSRYTVGEDLNGGNLDVIYQAPSGQITPIERISWLNPETKAEYRKACGV